MSDPGAKSSPGGTGLWIGVGVVFALMALAWAAMFFFATKNRPAEVPLDNRPAQESPR